MIQEEKIKKICSEYDIGSHSSIEKVQEGVLNDNYILETTTGKYFIKSVREKAKDRLEMIFGVESLMKSRGIPAIAMIKTKSGSIFVKDEIEIYTLYPFIEAESGSNYSSKDYKTMGEMLGKIHVVGSGDISSVPNLKQFKRPEDGVILERLKNYKDQINSKNSRDDIDEKFLEYIDFKLAIAPKLRSVELKSDTLIHGDYHPNNILIDRQSQEIVGVCDWEKAEFAPRAYELARSLLYSCFYDGYKLDRALTNSKLFLEGYLFIYPMSRVEIIEGFNMRIHRMALSSWIEEKYYKDQDDRANKFIQHEMDLIDSLVNMELKDRIVNLI